MSDTDVVMGEGAVDNGEGGDSESDAVDDLITLSENEENEEVMVNVNDDEGDEDDGLVTLERKKRSFSSVGMWW